MLALFLQMSCEGNIHRHSSLKRVNSNLEAEDEDAKSVFISGNLSNRPTNLYDSDLEEDDEDNDLFEDCDEVADEETISWKDVEKADLVLGETFGIDNVLKKFIQLLLTEKISPSDLAVQGLIYKVQHLKNGPKSVRYLSSWGMFWAGIRNLTKSRGLVPFTEHFCIPSRLSKFKDMILDLCGLKKEMLGKPGLQRESVQLFVSGKKREIEGKTLCVSVSLDGKKIAVTPGRGGREDMGGLADMDSPEDDDNKHNDEKNKMLALVDKNDRKKLFSAYDFMSQAAQSLLGSIAGVKKLIETNTKRLEKNPRLNKYIYVLNQKLLSGKSLLNSLDGIQARLIKLIAIKRNCLNLTPTADAIPENLANQQNLCQLSRVEHDEDMRNVHAIEIFKKACKQVDDPLANFEDILSRPMKEIHRGSNTFNAVLDLCYLHTDQVFQAAGLSKIRPLQEMKQFYKQSHEHTQKETYPLKIKDLVLKTFCAQFAPISFGANMIVQEFGLSVADKLVSTPDLVVVNGAGMLIYTVIFREVEDTFEISDELVTSAILTSHCCNTSKGSLVVTYSDSSFVVSSVPNSAKLSEEFVSLILSYSTGTKCLTKRSKQLNEKISLVRNSLTSTMKKVITLGSYPLVHSNNSPSFDVNLLKEDINKFLDAHHNYESKSARELIAVNINDLSGCVSKLPHTILAGAFLSSASLKVVAKDVIKETTDMLSDMGVAVLNYGVDGESLGLATILPNGAPGTLLTLAKYLMKKLQLFSKKDLAKMCTENRNIIISDETDLPDETNLQDDPEDEIGNIEDVDLDINNSVAAIQHDKRGGLDIFSLEDLESWLSSDEGYSKEREITCRQLKKEEMKLACLKYILPMAKKEWLRQILGREGFNIILSDSEIFYTPNTVFMQSEPGLYRTITFDMAHLANLLRESSAKNRLSSLGLSLESLEQLSRQEEFAYLKKILKLKNKQSLEFDPMNQKSSELLFSLKTEEGLRKCGDFEGSKCCQLLRKGIIESLDSSGITAEDRIQNIYELKKFLDEKTDVIKRLKKADNFNISNELFQMIHVSLDSHITTYANLEYFNPRRKGTGSVEMFFSQVTLMCDGGSQLNCQEIADILSRVMVTNALRLTPTSVKGFSFLANLGMHMTSYKTDEHEDEDNFYQKYPKLNRRIGLDINPKNSTFDLCRRKQKRKLIIKDVEPILGVIASGEQDGKVRKFHTKF